MPHNHTLQPHNHTLQLKVLDIVTNCLSNWNNPLLDVTTEAQKSAHSSMVFIHVKYKSSFSSFFKSAIRISTHRPQYFLKLEEFLKFIKNAKSLFL